jgi:hypothetical protein
MKTSIKREKKLQTLREEFGALTFVIALQFLAHQKSGSVGF